MLLSEIEIDNQIKSLSNWKNTNARLEKKIIFKNFNEAMIFINIIAVIAEEFNHHPDLNIVYNKVTIRLTTHDYGGITDKDFKLASAIDLI